MAGLGVCASAVWAPPPANLAYSPWPLFHTGHPESIVVSQECLPCPALPCPALPCPALHMQSNGLVCDAGLAELAGGAADPRGSATHLWCYHEKHRYITSLAYKPQR